MLKLIGSIIFLFSISANHPRDGLAGFPNIAFMVVQALLVTYLF